MKYAMASAIAMRLQREKVVARLSGLRGMRNVGDRCLSVETPPPGTGELPWERIHLQLHVG